MVSPQIKYTVEGLSVRFGQVEALNDVSLEIRKNEILAIIGPSRSGKTTFLRTLNRLNEQDSSLVVKGSVRMDGKDVRGIDAEQIRKRVGMVFALPLPLPLSIFENVAYGPRMHGVRSRRRLEEIAERSLKEAVIWEEVKDRLGESAFKLSGGQQQRLCIARTLAVGPEVILFDEPCSGLDPISTAKVEETMLRLKAGYTIVLVTNNVKQAARVGDRTAFFLNGKLIEIGDTDNIFTAPSDGRTDGYISGKFG